MSAWQSIAVAAALFGAGSAHSQAIWRHITDGKHGAYEIDAASVTLDSGGAVRFWTRQIFPPEREAQMDGSRFTR